VTPRAGTTLAAVASLAALAGCGSLQGFGGPAPELASFEVVTTGAPSGAPLHLRAALVWGRQWLVEPLCIVPPDPRDDAATVAPVIAAGCRDPLGFVPARVADDAPIAPGAPAALGLASLPAADVLVGDLTARVAYASVVVYDDRNANGTLDLAQPNRPAQSGPPMTGNVPTQTDDVVYGASFVAMTAADQRVAYREGAFVPSGFYPRAGCGAPPAGFSVLVASGFTAQAAVAATLAGTLPQEADPARCAERAPGDAPIEVPLADPAALAQRELACTERITDSSVRYREPPANPDLTGRRVACVHVPSFGAPSDVVEVVVSGLATDSCVGLTHYLLKGCREGPQCGTPDWDHSLAPPSWWPCK
jgi:hypothetical protein